jgi:hypothetical protein
MVFTTESVARELSLSCDIDDLKYVLMSLSLEKLFSPLATESGVVNKILNENLILGYKSSTLNFFIKFKIFSGVGFLAASQNFEC